MELYPFKIYLACSIALTVVISCPVKAEVIFKSEGVYFQNQLAASSTPYCTTSYFDFSPSLTLSQKSFFFAGLILSSFSTSEKDISGATTFWAEQNIGLTFGAYLGDQKQFSLAGSYMLISNSTYKAGSSSTESLLGTGNTSKASYLSMISKRMKLSVSLLYAQNNYTSSRIGTTINNVSRTKSYFLPIMGVQYTF